MLASEIPNAFTVDVEDYYQVSAFDERVSRKDWDKKKYQSRVEESTEKLLSILDEHNVRGTFFVLGWIADRFPALIKRIQFAGHELASHGYWHRLVYNQTDEEFARDIAQSRDAIANASGTVVTAYRAPSFSIVGRSIWALDILTEMGFTTDSSIFPIRGHDRYGISGARREIHEISTASGPITEFPPSAWSVGGMEIPIGGGYFRILPFCVTLKAIKMVRRAGRPAMFYIHPWEVDPEQPRIAGISRTSRFRHYSGLKRTESRLHRLLTEQPFSSLGDVIQQSFVESSAAKSPRLAMTA